MEGIASVILAAGASARMGTPKPLLRLGPEPLIERLLKAHRDAGVVDIRVVVGFDADVVTPVLARLGSRWVRNPRPEDGMFSSVQVGVRDLADTVRGFFVHPADVPLVTPATLARLADHLEGSTAVCPAFQGRQGHPPLLGAALIPAVLKYDGQGGLRQLLAALGDGLRTLECDDPAVLIDVDTPADWRRLRHMVRGASSTGRTPP